LKKEEELLAIAPQMTMSPEQMRRTEPPFRAGRRSEESLASGEIP